MDIHPSSVQQEAELVDMKERTGNSGWGEVLMVPVVGSSHVTPLMHVAKGLMDRGISITVVIPEDEEALVEKNLEAKYKEATDLVNLALVKSLSKVEVKDSGLVGMSTNLERACEPLLQKLLAEQKSGVVKIPRCIIADQFLGWTQDWANKLRIPRYVNFPSPASYAVMMLCHSSLEDLLCHGGLDDPNPVIDFPQLPVELHQTDLPGSFVRDHSFRRKVINKSGDSFREAAGILFNTFYELESMAIDSFQAQIEAEGKGTRMIPIGPMLPPAYFTENVFVGEAATDSKCIQWLDTRAASSVLYIAFGSWAFLTRDQIQELAHALEATQVSFLWILRMIPDESGDVLELLPPGFCDRTVGRGFVYSEFAPQLQILSHKSTGGFLTHCGWNSSLESISRGVPMVGWPMKAEQGVCCRVLVDLAKVATGIERRPDGSNAKEDIERAIRILMEEAQGRELKRNAVNLQLLARKAVSPGGSSHRSFELLAEEIRGQR